MTRKFKTVPNQKVVRTMKENPKTNFLQIKNEDWQQASRELTAGGFKVYLYLMSNANGYEFALSSSDCCEKTGISTSTYKRAVQELEEKNYLVQTAGNCYNAYNSPRSIKMTPPEERGIKMTPPVVSNCYHTQYQNDTTGGSKMNQEIDKKDNINKIDSSLSVEARIEEAKRKLLAEGITEEEYSIMYNSKKKSDWEKFPDCKLMFDLKFQNEKLAAVRAKNARFEAAKELHAQQEQTATTWVEEEPERFIIKGKVV